MGIIGPIVGYITYRALRNTTTNMYLTVFLVTALADIFTYVTTSFELALAYPCGNRGSCQFICALHGNICHHPDPAGNCGRDCAYTRFQVYSGTQTGCPYQAENLL